jgi:hypothetical protein
MRLQNTSKIKCCFPLCCLNPGDPDSVSNWIVIWDFFVLFWVILWDLWYVEQIGYVPLIFNLFYITLLFFVVFDLRHPENNLQLTSCFNYFRALACVGFLLAAIASLIFMFILVANPLREHQYFSWRWFLFYFFMTTIIGLVQYSTVYKLREAIRILRSNNVYDNNINQLGFNLAHQKSLGMLSSTMLNRSDLMDVPYAKPSVYNV